MSDVRTVFVNSRHIGGDWLLSGPTLASDDGLDTAVIISLFSDARARPGDTLPSQDDRRGWWGDAWPVTSGDVLGSRLWLLARSKQLQQSLNDARSFAEEALKWLVRDGIASAVTVDASIPRFEVLGLSVTISRPRGAPVRYRFEVLWEALS